jgi:hypothetical protein
LKHLLQVGAAACSSAESKKHKKAPEHDHDIFEAAERGDVALVKEFLTANPACIKNQNCMYSPSDSSLLDHSHFHQGSGATGSGGLCRPAERAHTHQTAGHVKGGYPRKK